MRKLFLIIACLFSLACGAQNKPINETKFTEIYLDSLQNKYPDTKFEIKGYLEIEGEFTEGTFKFYLDNAFKEYTGNPASLGATISKYISSVNSLLNGNNAANAYKILPVIKPVEYIEEIPKLFNIDRSEIDKYVVYEKYNDQLVIFYVKDFEDRIGYLNREDMEKLKLYTDDVAKIALENLREMLPQLQLMAMGKSYGLVFGGVYEVSLLLLPEIWTNDNFKVDGDIVVAIPNRDLVFITGSKNKPEIKKIKASVEESHSTYEYPISQYLFRWNGKKFVLFE